MSFEMKYDKNGMPIKGQEPVIQEEPTPEVATSPEENLQQETQVSEEVDNTPEENLQQETKISEPTQPVKPSKEDNLKILRERSERLERERDEAVRVAQDLQSKMQPKTIEPEEDLNVNLNPDDFVEGKHLSKVDKKIRKLEEQVKQYQQKATEISLEAQLRTQYPDFDKVVTKENIDALRLSDPDIADAIYYTPDIYKKASLAYKMIKKLNIGQEDVYSKDREIAQRNAAKPKPVNIVSPQQGESPLSKANAFADGLTDELKLQLRKEMENARKNM